MDRFGEDSSQPEQENTAFVAAALPRFVTRIEDAEGGVHDIPALEEISSAARPETGAQDAPSQQDDAGRGPQSETASASSPTLSERVHAGLPPRLPPRPNTPSSTPSGSLYHIPSETASRLSSPQQRQPFRLNPRAQPFDAVAHLYRQRGPPPPDPGEVSPGADARERRRVDAVYHMAMVYRRLIASNFDAEAEDLNQRFTAIFGEEYENERTRVIMEEPGEPPGAEEEVEGDDFGGVD